MIIKRYNVRFKNIGNDTDKNALFEKTSYLSMHSPAKMASQPIANGTSLIAEHDHLNSVITVSNKVDNKFNEKDSMFFPQINFDDFCLIQRILTEDVTTLNDTKNTAAFNSSDTRVSPQMDIFDQSNQKSNFALVVESKSWECTHFDTQNIASLPIHHKSLQLEKASCEVQAVLNSLVDRVSVMSEHRDYANSNAILQQNTRYEEAHATNSKTFFCDLQARRLQTDYDSKQMSDKLGECEETSVPVLHCEELHEVVPRVMVETLQGSYVDRCVSVWNRFIGCTKSNQKKNLLYTVKELQTLYEERNKQITENEAKDSSKDEEASQQKPDPELLEKGKKLDGVQQQSPLPPHATKIRFRHLNHSFACHVRPGAGRKLSSFENIVAGVKAASPTALRVLHFVLFGTYGQYSTDKQLNTTKANILLFSGFPYDVQSEIYDKKEKTLLRLPFPILLEIQSAFCLYCKQEKAEIVNKLLQFLWKPSEIYHQKEKNEVDTEDFDNEEYTWKQQALYSRCFVSLVKLSEDLIEQMTSPVTQTIESQIQSDKLKGSKRLFSSCIQASHGPGRRLRDCCDVAKNIHSAKSKVIKLLHTLLFGQPNSGPRGRRHILQFSGFTDMRRSSAQQRASFLARLANWELREIHRSLGLGLGGLSRAKQMEKILHFLRSPRPLHPPPVDNCKQVVHERSSLDSKRIHEDEFKKAIENLAVKSKVIVSSDAVLQNGVEQSQHQLGNECESPISSSEECAASGPVIEGSPNVLKNDLPTLKTLKQSTQNAKSIKLPSVVEIKDFERMRFNIANATTRDLKPLYDLLFLCSSQTEILDMRERILGFKLSSISNMQSTDFLCRKTLLSLMSSQQVVGVGRLLDLPLRSGLPELTDTVLRLLAKAAPHQASSSC